MKQRRQTKRKIREMEICTYTASKMSNKWSTHIM